MAEGFVSNEDLFSKDLFEKTKKDLDVFIKQVDKLDEGFIKLGKDFESAFAKLDLSKTKDLEQLNTLITKGSKATKDLGDTQIENIQLKKQLVKLQKDLIKLEQQNIKIKETEAKAVKKTTELTDEERKAKIKAQKASSELNKKIKEQIELEDFLGREISDTNDLIEVGLAIQKRELKTKAEINEANKLLSKIIKQLNIDVKEEKEVIDSLNATIDVNNSRLDENSSQFEKSKRNVGNYTESIKEALGSTDLLGEEFKQIQTGLTTLLNVFKKDDKQKEEQEKQQKKNTKATKDNTQAKKVNAKATRDNAEANEELADATGEATEKTSKFNDTLKGSLIGAIVASILALTAAFTSGSGGAEDFGKALAYITGTLKALLGQVASLGKVIIAIGKDLGNLSLSALRNGTAFDETGKAVDNFNAGLSDLGGTIKASIQAAQDYAKANNELNRELSLRLPLLAKLQAQEQLYIDLVDDDTLSMSTRNKLIDVSIAKTNEYFNAQIKQAKQQLILLESQLKSEIIGKQGVRVALSNYSSLSEAVKAGNKTVLDALSLEQIQSVGEALAEVVTQEEEFFAKRRDNGEKIRKLQRDDFELKVDQERDFTEKLFVQQEKIAAQTSKNLADRVKATEELNRVQEESFQREIKLIEQERDRNIKASIEADKIALKGVTNAKQRDKLLKDIAEKEVLINTKIDQRALLEAANGKEFSEYVRLLGLNEIGENVLLASVRDKLDKQQAFNDAKQEEINFTRETQDLQAEILDQQKQIDEFEPAQSIDLTGKTLEEIEVIEAEIEAKKEARAQRAIARDNELRATKITNLQAEIDARKANGEVDSVDILTAQKELNDLILENEQELTKQLDEENQKRVESEKKALEDAEKLKQKQLEEYLDTLNKVSDAFQQVFDEQRNKRQAQNEKDLQKSLSNQDFLKQQIVAGNADANKSLQAENEKQNEIEKRKIDEEKRRVQEELIITGIKLYGNLISSGSNSQEAIGKTITDVEVLKLLLKGVSKFYHGTDDTGSKGLFRDEFGPVTGVTHANEQVITHKERGLMGYKPTSEIIDAVKFSDKFKQTGGVMFDVSSLESEMRLTRKAIENMPVTEIDYNTLNGIITHKIKRGTNAVAKKTTLKNAYL